MLWFGMASRRAARASGISSAPAVPIAVTACVGVSIVGIVIWIRNSMTRYLRYWIIRLVYEQREQTERIVDALRER